MVPPPATGDEFPDFDSMTPEEQMAWLESLAKRQGVKDEELTTSANMEIAEVSADVVIDEPGYVPFEGSVSARKMKEAAEAAAAQAALEPEPEPEPIADVLPEFDLPEAEADLDFDSILAEAGDASDPMQWLGGLSAEPNEAIGELEDLFADAGGWEDNVMPLDLPDLPVAPEPVASAVEPPLPPEPVVEAAAPEIDPDDPLGGMDPMLFLESLARKQGVDQSELTTSADAEIAEVDPNSVIDEPGYVPFEGSVSARKMKEAAEAAAAQVVREPEPEPVVEAPPSLPDEAPSLDFGDLFDSTEPVAAEPSYAEDSPFDSLLAEEADETELAEMPELFAEEMGDDSALSWLEDLAAGPDDEFSELFAEVDEPEVAELPAAPVHEPLTASVVDRDDPLAGMTDDDIARAQASGELTPQQELEWLKRQAAGLAATRDTFADEDDDVDFEEVELTPAQPGEMPSWLLQMRDDESEVPGEPEAAALFMAEDSVADMLAATELPGLFEGAAPSIDFDEAGLALDTDELSPADVDTLWAEEPLPVEFDFPDIGPDSELAAFIKGDLVPEADPLAEALDAEFERKALGDETEPEWYAKAKEQVESGALILPEAEASESPAPIDAPEPVVAPAEPVEMPDWLKEQVGQAPVAAPVDDMPDWLADSGREEPAAVEAGVMPNWLAQEVEPETAASDMPDWLSEVAGDASVEAPAEPAWISEPEPTAIVVEPEPSPAAPPPVPAPVAQVAPPPVSSAPVQPEVPVSAPPVIPEGELFAQYRQRLEADPRDHASRLALARALLGQQQVVPSLDHYEALIQSSQLLMDVANDLTNLAKAQSSVPRIRRLLGDTYMRQGRLQEALDAYRSALNQL